MSCSVVLGLFAYNLGAAILCAWMAVATTLRGFMLLPAATYMSLLRECCCHSLWSGGQFVLLRSARRSDSSYLGPSSAAQVNLSSRVLPSSPPQLLAPGKGSCTLSMTRWASSRMLHRVEEVTERPFRQFSGKAVFRQLAEGVDPSE